LKIRILTILEDQDTRLAIPEEQNITESDLPIPLEDFLSDEESQTPIPDPQPKIVDEEPKILNLPGDSPIEISSVEIEFTPENLRPETVEILRTIDSDPNRVWEPDEIQLVEQVQNQLELALENANLFQQTQRALAETDEQARKLRLLNNLSEQLSQTSTLLEVYDVTADISKEIFNANGTAIATWSNDLSDLEICAASGPHFENQIGFKVEKEDKAFHQPIEDYRIQINPEFENSKYPKLNSSIAGPIYASGEKLGVLLIAKEEADAFDKKDENFMAQLLSILNSVVENRKLFQTIEAALSTTEEQARRLAELNRLSEMLSEANTSESVLSITMEMIGQIIPCKVCQTALWIEDAQIFTIYDFNEGEAIESGNIKKSPNTIINAVTTQKKLITENNLKGSIFSDAKNLAETKHIQTMIASPLLSGEEAIGAILIGNTKDFIYTSKEETLMQSISSIMVSTLENRRLFRQIQRRSAQLETSAEVSRIASTILDPSELLPEVVELIKKGFNLYYAGIFLIDVDGDLTGESNKWAVLHAGSGFQGQQLLEAGHKLEIGGNSMIGSAIATAEARIALDVGSEAVFFRNPYLPDTRSEMALPLISRGQVLGALTIQSDQEKSFTPEDITSLQTMSDQLANAIENAHLFEQTEARAEELVVLNEMGAAFAQADNEEFINDNIYKYTSMLMDTSQFYVSLYHEEEQVISFPFVMMDGERVTKDHHEFDQWYARPVGTGLTGYIIENKLPILIDNNAEKTLQDLGLPFLRFGEETLSWLGVPMIIGDRILGVISVQSETTPNLYNRHHLDLLTTIASQAAVAINNTRLFNQEQDRAKQEHTVRTITDKVRRGTDTMNMMQIALEELSQVLNADMSSIQLGSQEKLLKEQEKLQQNPAKTQNGKEHS